MLGVIRTSSDSSVLASWYDDADFEPRASKHVQLTMGTRFMLVKDFLMITMVVVLLRQVPIVAAMMDTCLPRTGGRGQMIADRCWFSLSFDRYRMSMRL
jgi:hypothetical protein